MTVQTSEDQEAQTKQQRAKRLGRARTELVALPDLVHELARCRTEQIPTDGTGSTGKPGSRPPLRIDVLALTDDRRKPGWEGDDPRQANLTERYGVGPLLETWTRVLAEESPDYPELTEQATVRSEAAVLLEHWPWIAEQQWATELADDVIRVAGWVKVALGMRRHDPRYTCPECGNQAYVVAGGFLSCGIEEHDQSIRDLESQYRRRPPLSTADVCTEFAISPERVYQWHARRKIKPTREEGRTKFWLPWDVFCLLNPAIREALDARDEAVSA